MRGLINAEKIHRIYINTMASEHGEAIDQTEILFQKLHPHFQKKFRAMEKLYPSFEAALIFKKTLLLELFRCIYIYNDLKRIEERETQASKILFVPDLYCFYESQIRRHGNYFFESFRKIKIPVGFQWGAWGVRMLRRFGEGWGGFCLLWVRCVKGRILFSFRRQSSRAFFKNVMAVHQEIETKFQNRRGFDFLVDEKHFRKEELAFLFYLPLSSETRLRLNEKKYHFLDAARQTALPPLSARFWAALFRLPFLRTQGFPFHKAWFWALEVFCFHHALQKNIRFENYIYTNQESPRQIALNILIRNRGAQTWNYALFVGGGLLYVPRREDFPARRHCLWAFLNSDHYVGINDDAALYFKTHYQKVHEYHTVGSLYSELVREISESVPKEVLVEKYFPQQMPSGRKIISFFDTSFIDSPDCRTTTFDDALSFYREILKLLQEIPEPLFIIKTKKNPAYFLAPDSQWSSLRKGKELMALWEELRANPCVFWAGDAGDIPSILAVSDLVISYCFSSTTVEALGAGKKAIWYESRDNHVGLYYDAIPGLVVHGYEDLKKRIHELLEEDPQNYQTYFQQHILGRVESHGDGLALTRFRKLLAGVS